MPAGVQRAWVVHLDMDAFFASVEQLTRPTLRGRPVLVGGRGGRGVVAGASYEARAYGARSAMPMHQAVRLCRSRAVVVRPRPVVYAAASHRMFDVLSRWSGTVEKVSIDEAFCVLPEERAPDAAAAEAWGRQLQAAVQEHTGLPCSLGIARTKLDAKIASDLGKPLGVTVITDRQAQLYGLPVGAV